MGGAGRTDPGIAVPHDAAQAHYFGARRTKGRTCHLQGFSGFAECAADWEQRSGPTFGFRIACDTIAWKKEEREMGQEIYWPGMFILLQKGRENDYAYINIRGARNGGDYKAKQIETTGWWTMGISVSPDGMVHYYAKPGIEDLTEEDRIGSQYPYGYKAHHFRAFFFNVCNFDNGRNWSTPWVVDDCKFYISPRGTAGQYIMRR